MDETNVADAPAVAPAIDGRAALLAAIDLPRERVDVPELGTSFLVQGMSGESRDAFEMTLLAPTANKRRMVSDNTNYRAKLLVFSLVNDDGSLMFTVNDIAQIGKIRSDVLSRLADVALRLSGLRRDEEEAQKK